MTSKMYKVYKPEIILATTEEANKERITSPKGKYYSHELLHYVILQEFFSGRMTCKSAWTIHMEKVSIIETHLTEVWSCIQQISK